MRLGIPILALSLALAVSGGASADTVISNLTNTTFGVDTGSHDASAQSFIAQKTEMLDSITLKLLNGNSGGEITVSLYSDINNSPNQDLQTLGTLTQASSTSVYSDYTINASAPLELVAGTQYWVVGSWKTDPKIWAYTSDYQDYQGSAMLGPYGQLDSGSWTVYPVADGPYQFAVNASVPEPGAALLAVMGLSGVAGFVLRRR